MIPGLDRIDADADLHDHAGHLMAVHRRQRPAPRAIDERDVAVTDAARQDAHRDLAWSRRLKLDVLHRERLSELVTYSSAQCFVRQGKQ